MPYTLKSLMMVPMPQAICHPSCDVQFCFFGNLQQTPDYEDSARYILYFLIQTTCIINTEIHIIYVHA